eukprot:TRINITY_DN482_c0_g1_i1.p3 TRINITY_DN482_c0_g1~~TRINITY_DN482_c0_g1_i1.p3  ORF type:complete len:171 (+),score=23.56 TRINITY_DN482_c0_g1_i1:22-513(+)
MSAEVEVNVADIDSHQLEHVREPEYDRPGRESHDLGDGRGGEHNEVSERRGRSDRHDRDDRRESDSSKRSQAGPDGSNAEGCNLHVANIAPITQEPALRKLFEPHGKISNCKIVLDPHTRISPLLPALQPALHSPTAPTTRKIAPLSPLLRPLSLSPSAEVST